MQGIQSQLFDDAHELKMAVFKLKGFLRVTSQAFELAQGRRNRYDQFDLGSTKNSATYGQNLTFLKFW